MQLEYRQSDKYASFLFENDARLGIKKASEEREAPGSQTIFLATDDAKAEYARALAKNLKIYKELVVVDWGIEFSLLDPDGNKVEYLQRS